MAYASESALPILAQSLVTPPESGIEIDSENNIEPRDLKPRSGTWSLQDDIDSGFQDHPNGIFQTGTVIGISTLRSQQRNGNVDDLTGQLPRHLLSAYLHKQPKSPTPLPRAMIIHPATYEGFSPRNLFSSLLAPSQKPQFTREDAITCLDSVQLFPVYDVAAAVQAISEISDMLDRSRDERARRQSSGQSSEHSGSSVLLIVAGLDTLAEAAVRASNTVRGAAILTTALRSLTHLSRVHSSFLSVMLVNTNGLGSFGTFANAPNYMQQSNPRKDYQDDGIHSIFHTSESPLLPSLLMRTLDQGIDTHLLLSMTTTATVVEVIKDRVGEGVGNWCIWDRRAKR
ncbi:uncharacterized protein KD926_007899 [Aspergillus affinis]|uniref:uncharacterized protein n=1 Tax=Aspergillus affinis TaxID=1070780 RepID=UPI0022FE7666|nr:uncharacterized protein KD926_007899 [Aspergillus affinis]KAI9045484.1 hypothetical protein KD926_007899 [Aspergillus affinis]